MVGWMKRAGMVAAVGFAGWSCQSQEKQQVPAPAPSRTAATEPIGKHWIQDERLRQVMADVSQRMRESYPGGVPDDVESPSPALSRAFADAADLADGLARAADRIPSAIEGKRLSDEDRRGFMAEVTTLRTHAVQLKAAAEEHRLEPMQRALLGINATCLACHSKYKDISGEINFSKSAAALQSRESYAGVTAR